MSQLKPCPFCGTSPEEPKFRANFISCVEDIVVECGKCGAEWPKIAAYGLSDDEILNHFNRRATDPSRDALVEALKETLAIARRDEAGDFIQRAEDAIKQAYKVLKNDRM